MKARNFNASMSHFNEAWASDVLEIERGACNLGPDLVSDRLVIETKFCKRPNPTKYYKWTVRDDQLSYSSNFPGKFYWGLGFYELNCDISDINGNTKDLEKFVNFRELYIVEEDWMGQFPIHETSGESKFSSWEMNLLYPKFKDLPEVVEKLDVERGVLYFTRGVNLSDFFYIRDEVPF